MMSIPPSRLPRVPDEPRDSEVRRPSSGARLAFLLLPVLVPALFLTGCGADASAETSGDEAAASMTVASTEVAPQESAAPTASAAPNTVHIRAFDFQFEAPARIPAGPTRLIMANDGPDIHHVQLVRLTDGHTLIELLEEFEHGHGALPSWAVLVGGPNGTVPGVSAEAVVDLEPGRYALICVVPAPDGELHVMKGMVRPLEVGGAPASRAASDDRTILPGPTMVLDDYEFGLTGPVGAGLRSLHVTNQAEQAHEVVVFRLEAGRTPEEVLQWVATREGAPPGLPVGGATYLSPGEENEVILDFQPGEYALICFVPDAADGQPHFLHGMVEQITVR